MIGSIAQMATICWAAMSSGLAITDSDSMAPVCIRPATTAAEIRSPRNLGNITPWLGAPTWWPARPIRCSPLATDGGDSTWMTRSTAPMSMPSSSDEVATTAGSRPVFSSSSISARCSRDTDPWCALARTGGRTDGGAGLRHHLGGRAGQVGLGPQFAARQPLGVDLVQPGGQPLGEPPRVGEHDGRAVRLDQVDHPLLDVRPDRGAGHLAGRLPGEIVGGLPIALMSGTGTTTSTSICLVRRRLDDGDRSAAGQEPGHLLDRPDGRGQPDPLRRPVQQHVQPVQRDGQVGAAFGAGNGVDLVDDHGPDVGQHLPGPAGQQQEQRLRGGDQDVGAVPGEGPPVARRGIAGADRDRDLRQRQSARAATAPIPVSGDRRLRSTSTASAFSGDRYNTVHRAAGATWLAGRSGDQVVDRGQERGECLARPGGRDDQGVVAAADRVPGAGLRSGRFGERGGEPVPDQRVEPVQRSGRPGSLDPAAGAPPRHCAGPHRQWPAGAGLPGRPKPVDGCADQIPPDGGATRG